MFTFTFYINLKSSIYMFSMQGTLRCVNIKKGWIRCWKELKFHLLWEREKCYRQPLNCWKCLNSMPDSVQSKLSLTNTAFSDNVPLGTATFRILFQGPFSWSWLQIPISLPTAKHWRSDCSGRIFLRLREQSVVLLIWVTINLTNVKSSKDANSFHSMSLSSWHLNRCLQPITLPFLRMNGNC